MFLKPSQIPNQVLLIFCLLPVLLSQISSVSYGFQHISLFIIRPDTSLWYSEFDGTLWSPWQSLATQKVSFPYVCSWVYGRLDLFVINTTDPTNQTINHIYHDYDYNNGARWSQWETWGGDAKFASCICKEYQSMIVLSLTYYLMSVKNNKTADWKTIGQINPVALFMSQVSGVWVLDTLYLFTVGSIGSSTRMYYYIMTGDFTSDYWSEMSLTAYIGVSAISWDPSILDLFYVGPSNNLMHRTYLTSNFPLNFTEENLYGNINSTPSVASWGWGRFDVFAKGVDGYLWRISYDDCDGGWGKWGKMGNTQLF